MAPKMKIAALAMGALTACVLMALAAAFFAAGKLRGGGEAGTPARFAFAVGREGRVRSILGINALATSPEHLPVVNQNLMRPGASALNGRWIGGSPVNEQAVDELRASGRAFTVPSGTRVRVLSVSESSVVYLEVVEGVNAGRKGYIGASSVEVIGADGSFVPVVAPEEGAPAELPPIG